MENGWKIENLVDWLKIYDIYGIKDYIYDIKR